MQGSIEMIVEQLTPELISPQESLADCRERIDALDEDLAEALAQRMSYARLAYAARRVAGLPVYDGEQQNQSLERFAELMQDGPLGREAALGIMRPLVSVEVTMRPPKELVGDVAAYARDAEEARSIAEGAVEKLAEIDALIAHIIGERLLTALDVGRVKLARDEAIYNGAREAQVIARFVEWGEAGEVPERISRNTIVTVILASRNVQEMYVSAAASDLDQELEELTLDSVAAQ
jgi:chorismate mutase